MEPSYPPVPFETPAAGPPPERAEPDPDPVPVYDRAETRTNWKAVMLAAVLALAVGGAGGFAVGRSSAPKGATSLAQAIQLAAAGKLPRGNLQGPGGFGGGQPPGQGQGGQGQPGAGGGAGGFQGSITAVSGNVLTVQTQAGQVKVQLTGSTAIRRSASGSRADLAVGTTVQVRPELAASGSSGTVTAASITAEPTQ